jgi:hypothetical protein
MTKIRITRTITLVDEIPFSSIYYPNFTDPQQAVEFERQQPQEYKLQEFSSVLDSTPTTKVTNFIETIEVVE